MAADGNVPVLTFVNGPRAGESFPISSTDSTIVGRSPEAGLVLEEDSVSRKHARIYRSQGCVWVRDLGSRNGTSVNGHQVERYRLEVGDRVCVGASLMRVESLPAGEASRLFNRGDASSMAMSGRLEDISLADVLQWLSTSRKSGVLTVRGPRVGKLFLVQGNVSSAWLEGTEVHSPEKALLRMMRWSEGAFELDSSELAKNPDAAAQGESMNASLEGILMDSARQADELNHLAATHVLPQSHVSVVVPAKVDWNQLDADLKELVAVLVEAQHAETTWQDVACGLASDDVTLTKQILDLRERGVVEFDADLSQLEKPPLPVRSPSGNHLIVPGDPSAAGD